MQPLLLTLDEGYLLTAAPLDLERGITTLGLPAPAQPLLLGCGVASPSRRPWPHAWGSSSQLLLHCHSLALSAAAPDLGRGVSLHSCSSKVQPLLLLLDEGYLLTTAPSDLECGIAPLGPPAPTQLPLNFLDLLNLQDTILHS